MITRVLHFGSVDAADTVLVVVVVPRQKEKRGACENHSIDAEPSTNVVLPCETANRRTRPAV